MGSETRSTARPWEGPAPTSRRPGSPQRPICCRFPPQSSFMHFLTNRLSPRLSGWRVASHSPQLSTQIPAIRKPVFPSRFQTPQDSGVAYVGRPSLTRSPAARGAGSHWGARLPLLTPDGGMRGGETGPGHSHRHML